jgi:inhibitor of KinA sporulation pathway (predicted exonuclease)
VAAKLDQLIVIDLEATCWEDTPPDGQESEIIEIGVCVLDTQTGERVTQQSILVKPERSEVSPFCAELTTLTQAQVDAGVPFARACQILRRRYQAGDHAWASYGDYDRRQFEKQCRERGIAYPFGPTHINVKHLVALFHRLPTEVGLPQALALMDLALEGTHHRGVDDAWNTALVLSKLILQRRNELAS